MQVRKTNREKGYWKVRLFVRAPSWTECAGCFGGFTARPCDLNGAFSLHQFLLNYQ